MFFVEDYFADSVCLYKSADGILYAFDASPDSRLDLASLEGKVAILGGTILQNEIFAIAEGLCSLYVTTDEVKILGIPAEILALNNTVINGNVFRVPEGILGLEIRVFDLHVLHVLEGILACHSKAVDIHPLALKKRIHRVKGSIFHRNIRATPTKFLTVDITARKRDMLTLTQSLYAVELRFLDPDILIVPKGGTAGLGHGNVPYLGTAYMPKGIAQFKKTALHVYISALLESTFAIGGTCEGAVFHDRVLYIVERALFVICFAFVYHFVFHFCILHSAS